MLTDRRRTKSDGTSSHGLNTIRIMSVNCQSLISDNKKIAMQDLIETHNPEIILGCELHLDPQINSSEVFPSNYGNPYRKDRKLGKGGVFIVIRNDLITTEIKTNADCEIVWTKLTIWEVNHIGSYYRRPSSKLDMVENVTNFWFYFSICWG